VRTTAHDVAPLGRDDETGYGLLDVGAMLSKAPGAAETSVEVDDDPFYVRGVNSRRHPTLMTRSRSTTLKGQVSPAKDPADVYPVRLKKGERFVASAVVKGADALVFLALWKPAVGDFDVTSEITKQQIVTSGGFSATPELKMRVPTSGTYYVSVQASDAVDEDDPEAVVPTSEPYTLALTRKKLKTSSKARKPAPRKPAPKK
jgi:hypothetical protein